MKNKKGFTLVELLAIIVILEVIMVIAVPKILDVVNGSKTSSWKDNVGMIKKAIVTNSQLFDPETGVQKYSIGNLCSDTSKLSEIVKLEDTTVSCSSNVFTLTGQGQFAGKSATISCINSKCSISIENSAVVLAAGLYDSNNNLIASWDDLVNVYNIDLMWYQEDKYDKVYEYVSEEELAQFELDEAGWYDTTYTTKYNIENIKTPQIAIVLAQVAGDKKATQLVIPGSVNIIPDGAFWGINVSKVILQEGITELYSHVFYNGHVKEAVLPESLESTGQAIFSGNPLESINIPSKLTSIEYRSFENTHLKSIVIPDNIEAIGNKAFASSSLESVIFSKNLNEIGSYAFARTKLTSVIIPSSVIEIGSSAFVGCDMLTSATFNKTAGWVAKNWQENIPLDATSLENMATAATFLKTTYKDYGWINNN